MSPLDLDALRFAPATAGQPALVGVIAQDALTGEVLMLGWANREALERTQSDGVLWFWSRSWQCLWQKGETSGNVLRVVALAADCDGDAVLARVRADGPACHTGARACFDSPPTVRALGVVLDERIARARAPGAADSYTVRLARDRNLRLKKLGEEAVELALACAAEQPDPASVAAEAADLVYHALVACATAGVGVDAVLAELEARLERGSVSSSAATARARATSAAS